MTEKEPGRGKNKRPVSNEKTTASERALRAPEDGSPRFVQTPSHIYPINPQCGSRLRAGPFSGGTASFSQQIPKVICERSCRKAKTLTVKITHKIEKKRGKPKKNKKKWGSDAFSAKKNDKKRYKGTKNNEKPVKKEPAVTPGKDENGGNGFLRRGRDETTTGDVRGARSDGHGFTHIT